MNDTQQATEVWTVPGWGEELRCEALHELAPCSGKVTHRTNHGCSNPRLVCQSSYEACSEYANSSRFGACANCSERPKDHWSWIAV